MSTITATNNTAKIELFDRDGSLQSVQFVTVRGSRVSFGNGVMGGHHALKTPVGLIRRIALDWVADGANRRYMGQDDCEFTSIPEAAAAIQGELSKRAWPIDFGIESEQIVHGIEFWSYKSKSGKWAYSYSDTESFVGPFNSEDEMNLHLSAYALETASDRASDLCV